MTNDIHFNRILVPFDGNGFFPSSNGSTIINLLNTLEYNIISNYQIEEDQIADYNFINDNNKETIFFLYKIFVSYFMKCDFAKVLKGLDNYTYYGEEENYQIPPLEDFIDHYIDYDIPPDEIEGCKNIFSSLYEDFKQYILTDNFNEEGFYNYIMNNTSLKNPNSNTNEYYIGLTQCFIKWCLMLRRFVREYWQMELKDVVKNKYLEAETLTAYASARITDEELVDERIENLEEFINYVIDHVIKGTTRRDYFNQNRYSPRILLTLVGGKTILEWYTDIIVYYKRVPKTKDVLVNVQAQWMNYVKNNGYSFFTDDFLYAQFQDMVNKVIPEVNEIISVEQEKENLLKELQALKEKLNNKENEQKDILDKINKETESLDDEGKQKYKEYLDQQIQDQPLDNLKMMIALYSTIKDKYSTALYYENYYEDQLNVYVEKVNQLNSNITELQQMVDKKSNEIEKIKTQNQELENKIKEKTTANQELEKNNKTIKEQIIDLNIRGKNLQDEYNSLVNERNNLFALNSQLESENKKLEETNVNLTNEKIRLDKQLKEVKDKIKLKDENIAQLNDEITELNNKIINLKKTYEANMEQLNSKKSDEINKLKSKIESIENKSKTEYDKLQNDYKTRLDNSNVQINKLRSDIKDIENKSKTDYDKLQNDYKTRLDKSNAKINKLRSNIEDIENKSKAEIDKLNDDYKTRLNNSNAQISSKEAAIIQLEKEKEELNKKEIQLETKISELNQTIMGNNQIIKENQRIIDENNIRAAEIEEEKIKIQQEREENERLRNESINMLAANNEAINQNKILIAELQEKQKQNELREQQLIKVEEKLNDTLDKRIEEILCILPIEQDMEIRKFRFLFFAKIKEMYPDFPLELHEEDTNSNDIKLGSRNVRKWYDYFIEKNKSLIDDDFNPEGIISATDFRLNEENAIRNLIHNLKENNIFLDFMNFKLKLFDLTEEKQKQYFLERINHSKIGTAIFGTKTIDDWYNALVSQFFEHEE